MCILPTRQIKWQTEDEIHVSVLLNLSKWFQYVVSESHSQLYLRNSCMFTKLENVHNSIICITKMETTQMSIFSMHSDLQCQDDGIKLWNNDKVIQYLSDNEWPISYVEREWMKFRNIINGVRKKKSQKTIPIITPFL